MSDQLLQAIGQNIRRDSLVGSQELLVCPESAKHHVANNQQRPAIAQYLHRSIQRTPRAPFGAWVFARHVERLAFSLALCKLVVADWLSQASDLWSQLELGGRK